MKLAVVWGGRDKVNVTDKNPLLYVQGSVDKLVKVLKTNSWMCEEVKSETLDNYETWLKELVKDKEVNEFLFIFTGHGVYGKSNSQLNFQVCLEAHKATLPQMIDETLKAFKKEPKKMAFVIDSCYSGDALTERYNDKNFEILTSTAGTKAYEYEAFGCSAFTHYFCEIFNTPTQNDKIDLEQIAEFSKKDGRQSPLHSKALEKEKIIIGYNKEINKVTSQLKVKIPKYQELKEKIYEYYSRNTLGFEEIQKISEYSALIALVYKNKKEYLSCIFQELGIENKYLEAFETDECICFKSEAESSYEVKKIVLRIHQGTDGSIDNCWLEGWLWGDTEIMPKLEKLTDINFSKNGNYEELLSEYFSMVLKGKTLNTIPIDINLILDDELCKVDFKKMKISINGSLAQENLLNVTVQLLWRDQAFYKANKVKSWKTNSSIYNEKVEKKELIKNNIFPIEKKHKTQLISRCISNDKIIVISNHTLLETKELELIKTLGLPIVFSPVSSKPTEVSFVWSNNTMDELSSLAVNILEEHYLDIEYEEKEAIKNGREAPREEKNIQFIYDNYHDVANFKRLINEKDKAQ